MDVDSSPIYLNGAATPPRRRRKHSRSSESSPSGSASRSPLSPLMRRSPAGKRLPGRGWLESPSKRSRTLGAAAPAPPSFMAEAATSISAAALPFEYIECVVPGENVVRRMYTHEILAGIPATLTMFVITFFGGQFAASSGLDGPNHLFALSAVHDELVARGCRVFGVSLDSSHAHLRWLSSLPTDTHKKLTASLGMHHPMAGGMACMDAVVILDGQLRRRAILPCMGSHFNDRQLVSDVFSAVDYLSAEV